MLNEGFAGGSKKRRLLTVWGGGEDRTKGLSLKTQKPFEERKVIDRKMTKRRA